WRTHPGAPTPCQSFDDVRRALKLHGFSGSTSYHAARANPSTIQREARAKTRDHSAALSAISTVPLLWLAMRSAPVMMLSVVTARRTFATDSTSSPIVQRTSTKCITPRGSSGSALETAPRVAEPRDSILARGRLTRREIDVVHVHLDEMASGHH